MLSILKIRKDSPQVEGMDVGIYGAGRIGLAVLRRMKPFDVKLHYFDQYRLSPEIEKELNLTYHPNVESLFAACDVISIHTSLHPKTEHIINDNILKLMRRGSYIVNTARGKICDRDAIVRALESGQLAGAGAHAYTAGNATAGSEDAEKFKKK